MGMEGSNELVCEILSVFSSSIIVVGVGFRTQKVLIFLCPH
jgi:hypothetical protein